jgi:phage-related minor tail protein
MADDSTDAGDEELSGKMEGVRTRTRDLTTGSNAFARAITAAFAQGASGAKSFDSVLKSLALRLSSLSLNLALKPLTGALTGGLGKLFSGGLSGASADGTADAGAPIQAFAKGGVIATPSFFPLGSGRTGLAGEAGPEAIMPLARGPDGRLGVAASGGLAQHVTVNIATPDAESFRRSETYLTGLIARAVARGQRGL